MILPGDFILFINNVDCCSIPDIESFRKLITESNSKNFSKLTILMDGKNRNKIGTHYVDENNNDQNSDLGMNIADRTSLQPKKKRTVINSSPKLHEFESMKSLSDHCNQTFYIAHRSGCDCTNIEHICPASKKSINKGILIVPDPRKDCNPNVPTCFTYIKVDSENLHETEKYVAAKIDIKKQNYKIRCAQCLLFQEGNGFSCIYSMDPDVLESKISQANRKKISLKKQGQLYHDHCHFLIHVQCRLVSMEDKSFLLDRIMQQNSHLQQRYSDYDININIMRILYIYTLKVKNMLRTDSVRKQGEIILMGYEDNVDDKKKKVTLSINIPGGKRNLAESSYDCALRELEEETSITHDFVRPKEYTPRKMEKVNCIFEFILQ